MKVSPDEKTLISKATISSSLTKKFIRKEEQYKCRRILRKVVEGKIMTVILSLVTVYALIGVRLFGGNFIRMILDFG